MKPTLDADWPRLDPAAVIARPRSISVVRMIWLQHEWVRQRRSKSRRRPSRDVLCAEQVLYPGTQR
jgi:hypothetical protein